MRLFLLIIAATVLPFLWGWVAYWLMERIWPLTGESAAASESPPGAPPAAMPFDYRI